MIHVCYVVQTMYYGYRKFEFDKLFIIATISVTYNFRNFHHLQGQIFLLISGTSRSKNKKPSYR